jgi:acyl-ACP thioesterase
VSLFESEFYHSPDASNPLAVTALLAKCEIAAGIHAAQLNWSIDALQARGQSWVLTRIFGEFPRQIAFGTGLALTTFPSKADRFITCRDFILEDAQEQLLGHLRTEWLILDLTTRKAVKLPDSIQSVIYQPLQPEPLLLGWDEPVFETETREITISETDLDINRHVNNRRYIQWLLEGNTAAPDFLPRYFDIRFKAEALLGDTIQVVTKRVEDDWFGQIRRPSDGSVMVELKATFR